MSLQPLFIRFHEAIQLKRFDENAELREKRDRILTRLRDRLGRAHTFEWFNQGSYAMGTGVKPLRGDYDIDIGLKLNDTYTEDHDPVTVKGWVYEAVKDHTTDVEWRRPCITVYYVESGERKYHVDMAIFATSRYALQQLRLAIGKQNAGHAQREWQADDRKGFIADMERKLSGDDGAQQRRVIRYLKRWKAVHFPAEGHAAPSGHALTVAAYLWFSPKRSWDGSQYDDHAATAALVSSIRNGFQNVWDPDTGRYVRRITLKFPFQPGDDVFARMSNQQVSEFEQRLAKLAEWLAQASSSGSPTSLRRAFGDDFPLS